MKNRHAWQALENCGRPWDGGDYRLLSVSEKNWIKIIPLFCIYHVLGTGLSLAYFILCELGTIYIPILQMEKLRFRGSL